MNASLLSVRDVSFAYDDVDVIRGFRTELIAGEVTAIVGPNGAGKSTLVELMAGTLAPRRGAIERRGRVALVVQRAAVLRTLPLAVRDVAAIGAWGRGDTRNRRARRRAVDAALDRVGIADLAGRSIHEVSGGQRQRAFVAQGLVRLAEPGGVLLLDEPGAGLDAASRSGIREILAQEAARGHAVGWVTHDDADAAVADRVVTVAPPWGQATGFGARIGSSSTRPSARMATMPSTP